MFNMLNGKKSAAKNTLSRKGILENRRGDKELKKKVSQTSQTKKN